MRVYTAILSRLPIAVRARSLAQFLSFPSRKWNFARDHCATELALCVNIYSIFTNGNEPFGTGYFK